MADYELTVVPTLPPRTTAPLDVTVLDRATGTPRDDAAVTADVYNPLGAAVATNQGLTLLQAGTGVFRLIFDGAWTVAGGVPIEGLYCVELTVTRGLLTWSDRYWFNVSFTKE